jgi:hypothetical protein
MYELHLNCIDLRQIQSKTLYFKCDAIIQMNEKTAASFNIFGFSFFLDPCLYELLYKAAGVVY